jgi:hypothetical protein
VTVTTPVQKIKSKDLKAFLDAQKKQTRLLGAVEKHVLTKPLDTSRRHDILHPSEIVKDDWCAREAYYRIKMVKAGGIYQPDRPGLRLASIFEEGHGIHAKWQGWFREMGVLYSDDEVTLYSDEYVMRGSTDGWIVGLGDDCLIEIKSIGTGTLRFAGYGSLLEQEGSLEKAFEAIRRPLGAHRKQGQVYLHLAHLMEAQGLLERPAPKEIVFIYECKANQAFKEFVVQYDPSVVAEEFDLAKDIAWGLDNDRAPDCNIDPQNGCQKCAPYKEAT